MTKNGIKRVSIIFAAALFTASYAAETVNDVSTEINDLFGSSSPRTEAASPAPAAKAVQTAEKPAAAQEKQTVSEPLQIEQVKTAAMPTSEAASSESIRPSAAAQNTKNSESKVRTPMRSDQFTLALEPKKISYTLPKSIENARIELITLDGKVVSTTNHKFQDVGGTIDTTALSSGHYIVRLLNDTDNKSLLTRAVAISK